MFTLFSTNTDSTWEYKSSWVTTVWHLQNYYQLLQLHTDDKKSVLHIEYRPKKNHSPRNEQHNRQKKCYKFTQDLMCGHDKHSLTWWPVFEVIDPWKHHLTEITGKKMLSVKRQTCEFFSIPAPLPSYISTYFPTFLPPFPSLFLICPSISFSLLSYLSQSFRHFSNSLSPFFSSIIVFIPKYTHSFLSILQTPICTYLPPSISSLNPLFFLCLSGSLTFSLLFFGFYIFAFLNHFFHVSIPPSYLHEIHSFL